MYPSVSKCLRYLGRPSWRPREKNIGLFLFKKKIKFFVNSKFFKFFCHEVSWFGSGTGSGSGRIWIRKDLDPAGSGSGRIWIRQDLNPEGSGSGRIWIQKDLVRQDLDPEGSGSGRIWIRKDLDPRWPRMLYPDQDPRWNQCESTTLLAVNCFVSSRLWRWRRRSFKWKKRR